MLRRIEVKVKPLAVWSLDKPVGLLAHGLEVTASGEAGSPGVGEMKDRFTTLPLIQYKY